MQIIKLEDDRNFGRLLSSAPESAPKLVAIEKDERIVNMAIVCEGTHILLETADSKEAILIGLNYLADLDYPKAYSQVCWFLQQTELQQQFDGHKSYGFVQYLKTVNTEMERKEKKPM
ncbi:uncharacterized protein LOC132747072 [Ruditapes philippinarum]|uniref:uncharacterized protein LOC132747072 n=1 Tax=Ruditapes philippinarum TaxID=129788 RepID=UPI00295AA6AB|nr:uncharacterized protein LOC132747072 [Ruditapes philippinarum]XP_060592361.1 uncharacterized protein LOC132747072 [Ruditapes philippinarum]